MKELSKKVCKQCGEEKFVSDFYQDRGKPRANCKRCFYQNQDKKKKCDNQKNYYQKHKEARSEYNKSYYEKNKKALINYQKEYKAKNKEKVLKSLREIHHKNSQIPEYKIKRACRSRVNMALRNKAKKARKTSELIGCSISFLMEYLESKFQKGMSWQNYGKWHIDHIIPCSAFNLLDETEQRKCFNYKNLQPLWAKDNCSKGNRI